MRQCDPVASTEHNVTPSSSIKSADSNDSSEDRGICVNDESERDTPTDRITDRNQDLTIATIKTETFWENLNSHIRSGRFRMADLKK